MLTIKQITEDTEKVIKGLQKKHFDNAKETIEKVLEKNDVRRKTQTVLDNNLAEANKLSKSIGMLMKEGKKDEAEAAKARVAELKETNKTLQTEMDQAADDLKQLLYTIPNIPYDLVPEGAAAEDNLVVKSNLKECTDGDTVGNWNVNPSLGITNPLPHWELAKKYDLIDFDLYPIYSLLFYLYNFLLLP